MSYKERLRELDLPCLVYRKLWGDMIETYKMFTEKCDNAITPPITKLRDVHNRQTRGHDSHLQISKAKKSVICNFFRNRIVNFWNELPGQLLPKQNPACMPWV